jgi:hypothetical protein
MTYQSEDVQQILERAMTRQHEGRFTPQQLEEMANELGIPVAELQRAEQEWSLTRNVERDRQQYKAMKWRGFQWHLIPYLAVNGFLVLINLATGGNFWAIYPILGWGLGLFFHAWAVLPIRETAFQEWRRKRA